jgi:hypothetical protein
MCHYLTPSEREVYNPDKYNAFYLFAVVIPCSTQTANRVEYQYYVGYLQLTTVIKSISKS